jgi:acetyl-CoA carboxylase, biotin carboxylase subunit
MFKKVLIANRGAIACRIERTLKSLGIGSVAVYSAADANSLHVFEADEAVAIGPAPAAQSYLSFDAIFAAAEQTGAEAIHPGYGFLSENAEFAEVCQASGITFIGPRPEVIRTMGLKQRARAAMEEAGIPILPGSKGILKSAEEGIELANKIGYPVILKAAAGGGGRGMRVVREASELEANLTQAQSEAGAAFSCADVYLEKFIEAPRHIEFQVIADEFGNVEILGERECSIQRRHQKLLEEAPSPGVSEKLREKTSK